MLKITEYRFLWNTLGNLGTDSYLREQLVEIKLQVAGDTSESKTPSFSLSQRLGNALKTPAQYSRSISGSTRLV